jgi:hypothetical protein
MLASSGERIPPCGGAGAGVPLDAVLAEEASFQERLHQGQHALVCDPAAHPVHQGRVVDGVETRLDVASSTHS